MKLFLDSSFVIYLRYAESDAIEQYVHSLLEHSAKGDFQLIVNMIVIDETTWILMRKYRRPATEVLEFVDRILPLLDVIPLNREDYDAMKRAITTYGLRPSDALHVASMEKVGAVRIASEDQVFDKVPSLKRTWLGTRYEALS